jgi:HPt (histidine-containing phosphotransfer) domain-containing protein
MDKSLAPINTEICLKIANNDRNIAMKLLSMFIKELPEAKEDINTSFKSNDINNLKRHAHKLLGSSAYCGAENIQKDLNDISKHIKDNNREGLSTAIESLNKNISEVMDYYLENSLV